MKLFGISNHGLLTIGFLVAFLWGVILVEHAVNLKTQRQYDSLREGWPAASEPAPPKPGATPKPDGLAFS